MTTSEQLLPIPVLLVEDEPEMRLRSARILRDIGYHESAIDHADCVKSALEYLANQTPSMALVDLGLPDGSGADVIASFRQHSPAMLILVISGMSSQEAILGALIAGANGYLLKERDDLEIMLSIRCVMRGGAPIDPFLARSIIDNFMLFNKSKVGGKEGHSEKTLSAVSESHETLTSRQMCILQLVSDGLSNREISEHLCISKYTVESHIKNIYQKLTVCNRVSAVITARSLGLLS
ncbi:MULTISPECIES: response regulator transcription factor [unclassified Halomonas]|uniref:response regulator transcription factor n=1 Tax=Halomonas sp. N3-2A TaxID=2014541 RepID=UPI000B5B348A|nr:MULTISPECIES: response regulator transcription factor [unclassified Halomonas]ASK18187.1 DNA-binding response regulator [Halomonas sp. N3-2A]UTD55336.1 response regulator transcription factor [Halomonas sp. MS1]